MTIAVNIEANLNTKKLADGLRGLPATLGRVGRESGEALVDGVTAETNKIGDAARAIAKKMREQLQPALDALDDGVSSVVGRMREEFLDFVRTGEVDFRGMVNAIIADLARISFDLFVSGPLTDLLTNLGKQAIGGGGGSGLFSSILSLFGFGGTGKALGGPVSFGRPYVVGERGRELFVPNTSGTIVPNGAGGGAPIVFNVNAADADSFKRSETQIAAMLNRMVRRGQRNL